MVKTLMVALTPEPFEVVAYVLPAVYPPPALMSSIAVISPAPALGEGELESEEEGDEEIEDDGDVEIEVEGEEEAEGEEEIEDEREADGDGDEEIDVEGEDDADGDDEIEVDGDAELEGDEEIDVETDDEADVCDGDGEIEDDDDVEIEDDGERLSICVTRKTARDSLEPVSPATRVTRSPTAYPVPLLMSCHVAIASIAPSKTSRTDVAAAPASITPLINQFLTGKKKLFVAEMGSEVAIVFYGLTISLKPFANSGLILTPVYKGAREARNEY